MAGVAGRDRSAGWQRGGTHAAVPSLCLPIPALQTHPHFTEAFSEAWVSSLHWHFYLYHATSMLYLDLKEPGNLYEYSPILYFYFPVPRGFFTAVSAQKL